MLRCFALSPSGMRVSAESHQALIATKTITTTPATASRGTASSVASRAPSRLDFSAVEDIPRESIRVKASPSEGLPRAAKPEDREQERREEHLDAYDH